MAAIECLIPGMCDFPLDDFMALFGCGSSRFVSVEHLACERIGNGLSVGECPGMLLF